MPVAVRQNTAHQKSATAVKGITTPLQKRRPPSGQFTVVESIRRPAPPWLSSVIALQKITKPIAILSLASVLVLYGVHAMMERQWGKKFEDLDKLQSRNKALTILTERQKYQLPRNLEVADKGFAEIKQDRVLFIKPEPLRPALNQQQSRQSLLRQDRLPVGY